MRYLPVAIDTRDKNILVVGAGRVGLRKVKALLDTEFKIYVLAREIHPDLYRIQEENPDQVFLKEALVDQNFIFFGYDYLIIATDDPVANDYLEVYARDKKIPYIRSDAQSDCPLIMTKVISQGPISLGISTGGTNPTVTGLLASELEEVLKKHPPEKLDLLARVREGLVKRGRKDIAELMARLWQEETIHLEDFMEKIDQEEEARRLKEEEEGLEEAGNAED